MNSKKPKLIILFSGKRKAGKDFLADALLARYVILTFSSFDLMICINMNISMFCQNSQKKKQIFLGLANQWHKLFVYLNQSKSIGLKEWSLVLKNC